MKETKIARKDYDWSKALSDYLMRKKVKGDTFEDKIEEMAVLITLYFPLHNQLQITFQWWIYFTTSKRKRYSISHSPEVSCQSRALKLKSWNHNRRTSKRNTSAANCYISWRDTRTKYHFLSGSPPRNGCVFAPIKIDWSAGDKFI